MDSSRRRHVLRLVAGVGTAGLAGCSTSPGELLGQSQDGSAEPADTATPTPVPVPQSADFEFEHTEGSLTIRHAGDDPIPAGRLVVRSSDGTRVRWNELGSTAVREDGTVSAGDTARIGSSVLNWPDSVGGSETVRVVFMTESGSPTTLAKYVPAQQSGEQSSEQPSGSAGSILFADEFDDGEFLDRWRYAEGQDTDAFELREQDDVLFHQAPFEYGSNDNGTILSQDSFEATGRIRISARIRTLITDYWGYGFGLGFENTGVTLKNHKWEGFDRFAVFGVEDRPAEYASDYGAYGEQTNKAKFGPATVQSDFVTYSMTIDVDAGELLRVRRGDSTVETSMSVGDTAGPFEIHLGTDGGHEVEYEYIRLESLEG